MVSPLMGMGRVGGAGGHFVLAGMLADYITPGLHNITKQVALTQNTFMKSARRWEAGSWAITKATRATHAATLGVLVATAGMAMAYTSTAKATIEFERQLVNMNSILGETRDVMWQLGDQAVALSMKYNKSAQDIAAGMYHLTSAGLKANEIMTVLTPSMELAVATQGDYAKIAKDVVQVIKGFGMEMTDARHVADVMTYTIQKSLVTWDKLGEGIKFAMPWFSAAGLTFEELAAAVGLLSDRALEAGIGGRGLRQSLAMLIREVSEGKEKFAELGIVLADAEGNMLPLLDIVKQWRVAYPKMNVEAIAEMMQLLGIRGATAFSHLVVGMEEYEKKLNDLSNAAGTAARVAEEQMSSIGAQFQILKNEFLAPFETRDFADNISSLLEEIKPLILELTPVIAATMMNIGVMLKTLMENMDFGSMITQFLALANILINVFTAMDGAILKLAFGFQILAKMGRMNAIVMNIQSVAQAKLQTGMQQTMILQTGLQLGYDKETLARKAGTTQKQVETFAIDAQRTKMQQNIAIRELHVLQLKKEQIEGTKNNSIHQAYQAVLTGDIVKTKLSTITKEEKSIAQAKSTLATDAEKIALAGLDAQIIKVQGSEQVLILMEHNSATAKTGNALATQRLSMTMLGLNLELSAGIYAIMAYAQGSMVWAAALTALTGVLVGLTVAYYLEKSARDFGVWGLPLAAAAGAGAMALIAGIGLSMRAETAKQTAEFDKIEADMNKTRGLVGGGGGAGGAIAAGAYIQQGGVVAEEGMAWVHKDETIVPAEETGSKYEINIDLTGAVITTSKKEFGDMVGSTVVKYLEREKRMR